MSSTTYETVPSTAAAPAPTWPVTLGRILFTVPFFVSGLFHVMAPGSMAGLVPSWVPGGGTFWVFFTGVAMIAAGVSFVADRLTLWSGPLLALLLVVYVLTLHLPAVLAGDAMAMPSVTKDLALAGAALAIAFRKR